MFEATGMHGDASKANANLAEYDVLVMGKEAAYA